jgi:hypothetical protein
MSEGYRYFKLGTYNNLYGQHQCKVCPVGFICPDSGLLLPLKCPNGYVCDKPGIIYPSSICPAGFMCLGGVKHHIEKFPCFGIINLEECDASNYNLYTDIKMFNMNILDIISFNKTSHKYICCFNSINVNMM